MLHVMCEVEHEVIFISNLELSHFFSSVSNLWDSWINWIFSFHESIILCLEFLNNTTGMELTFPFIPVNWLQRYDVDYLLTVRPWFWEGLLKYSRRVESWPSLSLASLVVAVNLSLPNHLLVKSLSIWYFSIINEYKYIVECSWQQLLDLVKL